MQVRYIHRILVLLGFLLFVVVVGTAGYMWLLGVDFLSGLYMTIITISTVGYTEVAEMTRGAQIFSIILIVTSVGTVGFVLSKLGSFFKEGYLSESWRKGKMEKHIEQLKNHYIICGSGETGGYIIEQFKRRKVPFVVLEQDPTVVEELKEDENLLYIQGDATQEATLKHARIAKAKGLVATLSKDADNVYVVLTAREMNAKLHIVARAIDSSAHEKMRRAGANYTVSPNEIGGRKMAAMLLKPSTTYFMDSVIHTQDITLDLEEITINHHSELCKKELKDAKIPDKTGLIVLAIKKEDNDSFRFNPPGEEILESKDKIIVIGKHEQIEALRQLAKDTKDE